MKFKKSGFVVDGEVELIEKLPPGNAHPVRKVLRMMKIGQHFFVARVDWTRTGKTPLTMTNEVSKEKAWKFQFWKGWLVRMEWFYLDRSTNGRG